MSKVIIVRHGQASLGKANYDELSKKGVNQANLLGQYLKKHYQEPCSILAGTLTRHKQTALEIMKAYPNALELKLDPDWNEFDFKKLISLYLKLHPHETPKTGDIRAFFSILKKSMLAWSKDSLDYQSIDLESWDMFSKRVNRALSKVTDHDMHGPQIIVSSGGVIAITLMRILETSPNTMIDLNFQIRKTSYTELLIKPNRLNLIAFNQVNHLLETGDESLLSYA